MPAQTNNLYLIEDLDDASKSRQLAKSDLAALRTVANWIKSFVAKPHNDLGRAGAVCPFVPESLERKTLWLASEVIAGRSVPDVVQLIKRYKTTFLHAQHIDGKGANYKVIVVVFTDLPGIVPKAFLTTSCSNLQLSRMLKMESCSGRSTKATRGLRYTTRVSGHPNPPCRFCS